MTLNAATEVWNARPDHGPTHLGAKRRVVPSHIVNRDGFRPWQKLVYDTAMLGVSHQNRKVHWIHDEGKGNTGKTTIALSLATSNGGVLLDLEGRSSDLLHIVAGMQKETGEFPKIIVITAPRNIDFEQACHATSFIV